MGNYTIFLVFENPRRGRQARNFTTNVPKILDLKWSSEQIFFENGRWVPLVNLVDLKMEQQRENIWKIKSIATCYNPLQNPLEEKKRRVRGFSCYINIEQEKNNNSVLKGSLV